MFYERQPEEEREAYKNMLKILGMLSGLFSSNDAPYLVSRSQENCFCKYFHADNLGRQDSSADAKKDRIGVGLKTWVGRDDQKIAEFGRLRSYYAHMTGLELVKTIAEYRNERIRVTKNLNGLDEMIYHIVKRIPGSMQIIEHSFDYIDIDNISLLPNRGQDNNTYFTDGHHTYHFSTSKNTLYMIFEDLEILDSIDVTILQDPFAFLEQAYKGSGEEGEDKLPPIPELITEDEDENGPITLADNQLCLRLYSENKTQGKFVPERSGLNQWNAKGRVRHPNELYIPYQKEDRKRKPGFFPPRYTPFMIILPDGTHMKASVCQSDDKAIMSNPNKDLGKWLLRDVLGVPEGKLITYADLEKFGIDSVIFTKLDESRYLVDFCQLGTYDRAYHWDRLLSEQES